jgi:Ca-activated chloride channel family protein
MIYVRLITLLLAIAAGCVSMVAQGEDETIKVDSSIVVLNVAVTDASGKAVRGLDRSKFTILEDGVAMPIKTFDTEDLPFAAAILLDASGSMQDRMSLARAAAIEFLNGLRAGDNAAVYKFDSKVDVLQDFSNSRDLGDRFYDVKADGMTALNDAIFKAAGDLSNRPEKRRAIIVLSDGADTFSKKSSDKALKAAMAANVMIYTVDMSEKDISGERVQDRGVLKNFAEKSGGRFVETPGGAALRDAFTRIVNELGTQYTLSYQPADTKRDGKWHTIEIRVARPNLTIRTRKGYNAPKAK